MTYLISDIHGFVFTLTSLIDRITKEDADAKFVILGDVCDRGKYSKETVDYILSLGTRVHCLRGNHDDVFDYLVNGHSLSHPTEWVTLPVSHEKIIRWWLVYGLYETLVSYGISQPYEYPGPYGGRVIRTDAIMEELKEKVPSDHKEFFYNLPIFWENDTHFACHAYFDPRIELPRNMKFVKSDKYDEALWGRYTLPVQTKWDKIGVFGHTPVAVYERDDLIYSDKVRIIDGGAFLEGKMFGYCVETDDFITIDVDIRDR